MHVMCFIDFRAQPDLVVYQELLCVGSGSIDEVARSHVLFESTRINLVAVE